jgi:hypothetical protein
MIAHSQRRTQPRFTGLHRLHTREGWVTRIGETIRNTLIRITYGRGRSPQKHSEPSHNHSEPLRIRSGPIRPELLRIKHSESLTNSQNLQNTCSESLRICKTHVQNHSESKVEQVPTAQTFSESTRKCSESRRINVA